MARETEQGRGDDGRKRVLLDPSGAPREPLPAERVELEPEQRGEDDRLQPAGVRIRVVAGVGLGVLAFLAVVLASLLLYFRSQVGAQDAPAFARFPDPRLETNIDPRSWPAVRRGAVQPRPPIVPEPSAAILKAAMAQVLTRGAHAYDPLPDLHAPGPAAQGQDGANGRREEAGL